MKTQYNSYNKFKTYLTSGMIESQGCNVIHFENKGNVTARLNGDYLLRPDESLSLNQVSPLVVDRTQYQVQFDPLDPNSSGTDQNLQVITTFIEVIQLTEAEGQNCERF